VINALVDGRVLTLNSGYVFGQPRKGNILFLRRCYEDLFMRISNTISHGVKYDEKMFVILTGTPGIGKSCFIVYMLWRLYGRRAETGIQGVLLHGGSENVSGYVWFDFGEGRATAFWQSDQQLKDRLSDVTNAIYIVDGFPSKRLDVWFPTVCMRSPVEHSRDNLSKIAPTYWMPLWSERELEECRALCCSDWLDNDLMEERWVQYGGVARFVLKRMKEEGEGKETDIPPDLENVLGDRERCRTAFTDPNSLESQRLIHVSVAPDYTTWNMGFASTYVAIELGCRYEMHKMKVFADLFGAAGGGAMSGHALETHGHILFVKTEFKARTRRLLGQGEGEQAPVEEVVFRHERSRVFGEIPKSIEWGTYHRPRKSNFPAVDSFSSYGMFQFTVAMTHGINLEGVMRILSLYPKDKRPVRFYFCVQAHNFDSFEAQKFKVKTHAVGAPDGIEQYVLEVPLDVAEATGCVATATESGTDVRGVSASGVGAADASIGVGGASVSSIDVGGAGASSVGASVGARGGSVAVDAIAVTAAANATAAGMKRGRDGSGVGKSKRGRHV